MTSTIPEAFDEDEEKHELEESDNIRKPSHEDGAVHLNTPSKTPSQTYTTSHTYTTSQVKNGSTYNRKAKAGGVCSRITNSTLFRVFLLLLILALLIPILVLAALTYKGINRQDDYAGTSRMVGGLQANPGASNAVAGEDAAVPNAKNDKEYQQQMEEIYKKEPWRRDPTTAWKQLGTSLSNTIDPRGDACTDFYGYSCDQWKDRNPLQDRQEISDRTLAYERVRALILQTFDGMTKDDTSWPASVRWAKSFYDQCRTVNDDELAERKKSVVAFLQDTFAGHSDNVDHGHESAHAKRRHARSATETPHDMASHMNMTDHVTEVKQEIDHANDTLHGVEGTATPIIIETTPSPTVNGTEGTTPELATTVPVENGTALPEHLHLHVETTTEAVHINETDADNTTHAEVIQQGTPDIHRAEPTETPEVAKDIWEMAGALNQIGADNFFQVDYSKNPKNGEDFKTILRPPFLSLSSRRYYLEPYLSSKKLPELQQSIIDGVELFKSTPGSESALFPGDAATARDIVQFEQALAKASPAARPLFDYEFDELQSHFPNAKTYSLSNLQARWGGVNWDAFLPEQAKKGNRSNETPFIVTDPAYIDQLVGLLADYNHKTAVNFLKWRYINSLTDHLAKGDDVNGTCYNALENDMPLALAHVVYKTGYGVNQDEKSKMVYTQDAIQALFNRTVRAFKAIVEYSGQVSNSSRKPISDELSTRVLTTDWPDMVKDGQALDTVYTGTLQAPRNGTFIDQLNVLRSADFLDDQANVWSLAIPRAFTDTQYVGGKTIATVYDPRILNSQFSQAALGQFATVGWQMGRELAKSVRYLPNTPFQSSRVDQCLINQYNQFCYQSPINSCVDGAWTVCENVADTVGLEVAFKAYQTWESNMATSGASDAFPAFLAASNLGKFTLDQIFFLAYGASFCDNEARDYTIDTLATSEMSPEQYRLQGSVQNSNDFQLAFHCKAGDQMYSSPKGRCQFA